MSTKVVNLRKSDYDVYIGRGEDNKHMKNTEPKERGWLGNPFSLDEYERKESIKKFKISFYKKITQNKEFKDAVEKLEGKTLGCWCKPKDCHGDVILEFIEKDKPITLDFLKEYKNERQI